MCYYIFGEQVVSEESYSRFKFKHSSMLRSFCTWECNIIWQPLLILAAVPQVIASKFSIFHFIYLLKTHVSLNSTEWLVAMDWKNFEKDQRSFGTVLKTQQKKYLWKSSIFRNVAGGYILSKLSLYFKKMVSFTRKFLQKYSEICIFLW